MKKTYLLAVIFIGVNLLISHAVYGDDARDFERYFMLGNNYARNGNYDAAIVEYDKAIACVGITPSGGYTINFDSARHNMIQAWQNRTIAYIEKKDYDRVIKDSEMLINYNARDSKNNNFYGYYLRGMAYKYKKHFSKAISDFTSAIGIDSSNTDVYYHRADMYYIIFEFDKAREDINIVLQREPNNSKAKDLLEYIEEDEFIEKLLDQFYPRSKREQ